MSIPVRNCYFSFTYFSVVIENYALQDIFNNKYEVDNDMRQYKNVSYISVDVNIRGSVIKIKNKAPPQHDYPTYYNMFKNLGNV